jgi:hypothetical protein
MKTKKVINQTGTSGLGQTKKKVSTLRNRADKLYQTLGRLMYSQCFCGKPMSCLHHHHSKGSSSALRYEIKNGVPLCAGCHLRHHSASDPDIGFGYKLFMEDKWGKDWEIELRQQRLVNQYVKTDASWYLANIEILNNMIKQYE